MARKGGIAPVVTLGILWTAVQMYPARIVAQPGYVVVSRGSDIAASVSAASIQRDPLNFVMATVRYDGNRGAFKDVSVPNGDRVRILVVSVAVDCESAQMFEYDEQHYARDGSHVGQRQYDPSLRVTAPPGSINADVVDWICARAPAPRQTIVATTQTGRSSPTASPSQQESDRPLPESEARTVGSAFAVSPTDLLTNNHVVEGCSDVTVSKPNGDSFQGRIRARDVRNDLALISVGATTLASVARFRSTTIRAGEDVIAVGFPLAGLLATDLNVSKGIISATAGLLNDTSQLQISAEVQPGNSGGPLLDSAGAVAGVVVSKLDAIALARVTGDIPQNVNFAIKSELATVFLQSQGVQPRSAPVTAGTVTVSDTVEAARAYTFLVECLPDRQREVLAE